MADHLHSPIVRFGVGVWAVMFLFAAPVSGFFLTRIFLDARDSATWPTVPGRLTRAQVGETAVRRYYVDVAYTYRVGSREYVGTKVRASDGEYDRRAGAVRALRGLAAGQPVTVFYSPADPQRAVLRAGTGVQEYALLFVPVVMLGIGVSGFVLLWRTRHRAGPGRAGGNV
jgi:hypothetical protein